MSHTETATKRNPSVSGPVLLSFPWLVQVLKSLPRHVQVVDLSADFRLKDVDTYAKWYGGEHKAPDLQKEAIYGLTELHRDAISGARLVANPGCYPTCAQLPLVPLLQGGHIEKEGITIDAKSGASGAGRATKEAMLFCEVADGMHAYGVSSHRHMPEIEQGLSEAVGGQSVTVSFTPHLIPMSRGMLATIYVQLADGRSADDLRTALAEVYKNEYFVRSVSFWPFQAANCYMDVYSCSKVKHRHVRVIDF